LNPSHLIDNQAATPAASQGLIAISSQLSAVSYQ
jgi:hypothetical protein